MDKTVLLVPTNHNVAPRSFHESKPNPSVYMAGRISKGDWRHEIFLLQNASPENPPPDVKEFAYAGPYVDGQCRLANSDVVFAYIDGPNLFDALIELGIAIERNIPIFLAFGFPDATYDPDGNPALPFNSPRSRTRFLDTIQRDMKIAATLAEYSDIFGSPAVAWNRFVTWYRSRTLLIK